MKKTILLISSLVAVGLLAFVLNNNNETKSQVPQQSKEIQINSSLTKPQTPRKLAEEKLSAAPEEKNNSSVDMVQVNDTTNALIIKNRLERTAELVRFADLYTNNELLQYLASVHCISLDENPCDPKRFAQRLLSINPNNAIDKELLVTDSLMQNDLETALSLLENIKHVDDYDSYYFEVTNNIEYSLEEKLFSQELTIQDILNNSGLSNTANLHTLSKERLHNLAVQAYSIGIAAAQPINSKVFSTCFKEIKNNPQKNRWVNACHNYGLSMQKSRTLGDQFMGRKLELKMLELNGETDSAWQVQKIIEEQRNIIEKSSNLFHEEFILSRDFEIYTHEFKEHGELEAMRRLIERQPTN